MSAKTIRNPDAPIMLRNGKWLWPKHMSDPKKRQEYMTERNRRIKEKKMKYARKKNSGTRRIVIREEQPPISFAASRRP